MLCFFTCARKAKAVDDGVIRLAPHTGLGERQGVIALRGAPVVHCLREGREGDEKISVLLMEIELRVENS